MVRSQNRHTSETHRFRPFYGDNDNRVYTGVMIMVCRCANGCNSLPLNADVFVYTCNTCETRYISVGDKNISSNTLSQDRLQPLHFTDGDNCYDLRLKSSKDSFLTKLRLKVNNAWDQYKHTDWAAHMNWYLGGRSKVEPKTGNCAGGKLNLTQELLDASTVKANHVCGKAIQPDESKRDPV